MSQTKTVEQIRQFESVDLYRQEHPDAENWAVGYGQIEHNHETQQRVFAMAEVLHEQGCDREHLFEILSALDRVTNAGMWLVVHQTYTNKVYLDGRDLNPEDFKAKPEGHTGGSLNIVPAYAGYMGINAITNFTRSWIMGQGHCVSGINSINVLLNNLVDAHRNRYNLSQEGLTHFVEDFYSYKFNEHGQQASPLGSHVNPHTAGGIAEGGYLGFVQLEYVHMPLPGESLVTFLSDGAFEEQRGSDWTPRWWRAEDCGLVTPIMINNGRRIDQRSTMAQEGGTDWFIEHLRLNHFDPIVFDGKDPAAFVWAIWEMEQRLSAAAKAVQQGENGYPVRLPYGVAVAPKGAGFYNAGENLAHNLPLGNNPHKDRAAAQNFNENARKLWVPKPELTEAIALLQNHHDSNRPQERDHPLVKRNVSLQQIPPVDFQEITANRQDYQTWTHGEPMSAVDNTFVATVKANPNLRPRVGNPDEMKSNRMQQTLNHLKFRVTEPEEGIPEAVDGAVITALNEEAIAAAALGNKGGINMIVSYEAFGAKMHGVMRQEIIFAKHRQKMGLSNGWLAIPLVLTSHTWENGKNEQSHQDTMMAEAMLNEASDVSRVMFAADYNTAGVITQNVYQTQGQFWTMVVPKRSGIANLFTPEEAKTLLQQGAMQLDWASYQPQKAQVILTAIGAYQLEEVLKASKRLKEKEIPHSVVYMLEPGRFRLPRDAGEIAHAASEKLIEQLYPDSVLPRIFVSHTRPEPILGTLQPLSTGHQHTAALGFINEGGTLNRYGMLFMNHCTWGHILAETARILKMQPDDLLSVEEVKAIRGQTSPEGVIIPEN